MYVSINDRKSGRTESEAKLKVGAIPGRYKARSFESPSGFMKENMWAYTSKAFW
jgi:hypothetical protein